MKLTKHKPITEGQLAAAMAQHNLQRIAITVQPATGRKLTVLARAFPASWHAKVVERREIEMAKLGGEITLAQAQALTDGTLVAVAGFSAPTMDAALRGLLETLK